MKRPTSITASIAAVATSALLLAPVAPEARAEYNDIVFSNAGGDIRCEIISAPDGTYTKCVSERARKSQPKCNPPGEQIPAISMYKSFAGAHCWNQGFTRQPERLQPLQIRMHGSAMVVPWFDGEMYVFDFMRLGLIKAGATNQVLFRLF